MEAVLPLVGWAVRAPLASPHSLPTGSNSSPQVVASKKVSKHSQMSPKSEIAPH